MATTTFKEAALRAIALLGLLAVLLLGAWGIIQLAFFISDVFSNTGGEVSTTTSTEPAHETVTANVPAEATAGQPVTISWTHTGGSGNYAYSIAYSCATGLTFKAPVPTGSTQTVACNTPFNYTQAADHLAITPTLSGTADVQTTITVVATDLATGAVTAQGTGTLTVHPVKKAAPGSSTGSATRTAAGSTGSTYTAARRTANLYGYPDLQVAITSAYSQGGNATVTFVVTNVGTNVSPGNWSLVATLPTGQQYPSDPQPALYPGDKVAFTLNYSDYAGSYSPNYTYGTCNQYGPCAVPGYTGGYQPAPYGCTANSAYGYGCSGNAYPAYGGTKTVSVTVDPYNQVAESSKANNYASATYTAY